MAGDIENDLQQQVQSAMQRVERLNIVGGASKSFYGSGFDERERATEIHIAEHDGIINYDPAELVITARAGTRLAELEQLLAANRQMFGFEPPQFSAHASSATLGGAVAAGLAGPRRPWSGAVRDCVLGVKILNGKGEVLTFGGEVMKNVAGFDVARLMAGAMGTLGILLEVSLRLMPQPQCEKTVRLKHADPNVAIAFMNELAARPLPLSAAAWCAGETRLRLSASASAVHSAAHVIGGEDDADGEKFWQQLRDHELEFFHAAPPLLRVSLPPANELRIDGATQLIDWGGAQRWLCGEVDVNAVRRAATAQGGHATLFRQREQQASDAQTEVFHPLAGPLHALHVRMKHAFDPHGILNHGRLYRDL